MTLRQASISRVELSGLSFNDSENRHHPEELTGGSLDRNHFVPFGHQFILHPGRFVIGITLEWIRLAVNAGGYVTGKSSLGRHGLVIETAAAIHPRFTGCLALEIANVGEVPLVLRPGMPIAQLLIHETKGKPKASRTSLSGRRKPYLPTLKADDRLRALASVSAIRVATDPSKSTQPQS
jgi:dCTP deaminase